MGPARARLHPVEIRAHVVPRQVQHLAAKSPILLDLRLGFRRTPRELAVRLARLHDPAHRRLEFRMLQVEMHSKLRAQIRMTVGDHVDPLDRRDRLDILKPFERFDGRAQDDVLVGPWRVAGGVVPAVVPVSGVRALAGDATVPDRRIFPEPRDRARFLGGFHLGHLNAHDALVQDAGDEVRERLVDPHDGRDV